MKLSVPMTSASLLDTGKTLVIPIYQRLFVWREEQITNLLNDLCNSCQKDNNKDYHLGVITVHEDEKQQWEVVDGQQRLTFLTLLGCELIRASKIINANWADCWGRFLWRDASKNQLRLIFSGRKDERDDLQQFLKSEECKDARFEKPAFVRFSECFRKFVRGLSSDMLAPFSTYCFTHAAFLVNELPLGYGSEDLNLHFEKMNSTGRQLSPLEVVKGKWFAPLAARWNRCMNFDEEFTVWNKDEAETCEKAVLNLTDILSENAEYERVLKSEKSAGEDRPIKSRLVMKPEILALHALCCLYRRKELKEPIIQRQKLIGTFQSAVNGNVGFTSEDYLAELESYRKWVDANIIYLQETELGLTYEFRNKTMERSGHELTRMKQFQTMLHVSSGEAQEWVLKSYFESNREPLSYDALRKMEIGWHNEDSLDPKCLRYGTISRYWFWKLDYLLWELHQRDKKNALFAGLDEREHNAINEYQFRDNRSIEHLHPQAQGDATSAWGNRDDPAAAMHRFGNLAMMSVEGNSSQQDDPVQVKFGRVKAWLDHGRLESIKMLIMFHLADRTADGWTVDTAEKHEEKMISILQEDSVLSEVTK